MVTKLGQFTKLKCKEGSQKICHNFLVFENCQKPYFFLVNSIGQWIHGDEGRGITRDIQKNHFYFQHSTKKNNKVGTIYKAEM